MSDYYPLNINPNDKISPWNQKDLPPFILFSIKSCEQCSKEETPVNREGMCEDCHDEYESDYLDSLADE